MDEDGNFTTKPEPQPEQKWGEGKPLKKTH